MNENKIFSADSTLNTYYSPILYFLKPFSVNSIVTDIKDVEFIRELLCVTTSLLHPVQNLYY